ncbi:hypothetical protein [Hyphomicrobium sp.]
MTGGLGDLRERGTGTKHAYALWSGKREENHGKSDLKRMDRRF